MAHERRTSDRAGFTSPHETGAHERPAARQEAGRGIGAYWPAALLVPSIALAFALTPRGASARARAIALSQVRRVRRARRARGFAGGVRAFRPGFAGLVGLSGAAIALGVARWQLARHFTEELAYDVEKRIGALEIRRYPPRVLAETAAAAKDWDRALSEGFVRIAQYLFGKNQGARHVALLGPTSAGYAEAHARAHERRAPDGRDWQRWRDKGGRFVERPKGEKLAMTTPVMTAWNRGRFVVAFGMPKARGLMSLPTPKDARVVLRSVPSQRVAVLRFHGAYRARNVRAKEEELLDLVRDAGLTAVGEPMFAGYDPPTTLPFLRRLEVWVAIR